MSLFYMIKLSFIVNIKTKCVLNIGGENGCLPASGLSEAPGCPNQPSPEPLLYSPLMTKGLCQTLFSLFLLYS